jgi:hypothetical protein
MDFSEMECWYPVSSPTVFKVLSSIEKSLQECLQLGDWSILRGREQAFQ